MYIRDLSDFEYDTMTEVDEAEYVEIFKSSLQSKHAKAILQHIFIATGTQCQGLDSHGFSSSTNSSNSSDSGSDAGYSCGEASNDESSVDSDSSMSSRSSDGAPVVPTPAGKQVYLHPPVDHNCHEDYAPPFDTIGHTLTSQAPCDCKTAYPFDMCLQVTHFEPFKNAYLDIPLEMQNARGRVSANTEPVPESAPNSAMRFHLYSRVFACIDFGELDKGERRKLPNCAYAAIRQMYPSDDGCTLDTKRVGERNRIGEADDHSDDNSRIFNNNEIVVKTFTSYI